VKLTDFGLWFLSSRGQWSTTIPQAGWFSILYDGERLGYQGDYFNLAFPLSKRYTIRLTKPFPIVRSGPYSLPRYDIGHRLTMDDFEIVENPNYAGFE